MGGVRRVAAGLHPHSLHAIHAFQALAPQSLDPMASTPSHPPLCAPRQSTNWEHLEATPTADPYTYLPGEQRELSVRRSFQPLGVCRRWAFSALHSSLEEAEAWLK